jgi:hypothetical protein
MIAAIAAAIAMCSPAQGSVWQPPGIAPSSVDVHTVLTRVAAVAGSDDPRVMRRREHWTYANGARRIAVDVAVRDDDFRTTLQLEGLTYTAGRLGGARWRGDGNGIVHVVEGDLQGDALDRAPQALFRLDPSACTLAGEARLPMPAWVVRVDRPGDKAAYLYVDESAGTIVREVMRDGRRVITTTFDGFAPYGTSAMRPRHWHIDDGLRANTLDVTVDDIAPAAVAIADVGLPTRRTFDASQPLAESVDLHATFRRGGQIAVDVGMAGRTQMFLLDTGTASITVDPALARGGALEHATVAVMSVGPLRLAKASVLTVPFWAAGILGLDFFFGHVVEIDYLHERVRVLSDRDARAVFADPATRTVPINVDEGLPLAAADFGAAHSDFFAVDTGSPRLYVMRPFVERFTREIATHWTRNGASYVETYLEGGIQVQPYSVTEFTFGRTRQRDIIVGAQVPTALTDDLAMPFDGIVGTDFLGHFDLYFDYDNGRMGMRR